MRPESEFRQRFFNILVRKWAGSPIPLPFEAVHSVVKQLQRLRTEFANGISQKSTPLQNKLIALSFWYEVQTNQIAAYKRPV